MNSMRLVRRIRLLLVLFTLCLVTSGATAIPLPTEVRLLLQMVRAAGTAGFNVSGLIDWLTSVNGGLTQTSATYPFLAYGTDWLAFGHFAIAIAFVGPLRDPVKNVWVVEFGMIACALVVPFALGMGALRGIPLGWRLVDCSFGVVGMVPLWLSRSYIRELAGCTEPAL